MECAGSVFKNEGLGLERVRHKYDLKIYENIKKSDKNEGNKEDIDPRMD